MDAGLLGKEEEVSYDPSNIGKITSIQFAVTKTNPPITQSKSNEQSVQQTPQPSNFSGCDPSSICKMLREKYSTLINKFYGIAERKVSIVDDYGDENWAALDKEIERVISKIAAVEGWGEDTEEQTMAEKQAFYSGMLWIGKEGRNSEGMAAHRFREKFGTWPRGLRRVASPPSFECQQFDKHCRLKWSNGMKIGNEKVDWTPPSKSRTTNCSSLARAYKELSKFLSQSFRDQHAKGKSEQPRACNYLIMSGIDFEIYIKELLGSLGLENIQHTPITNDQGADLLARKDGRLIVIQAKRYSCPVGNSAVQEVLGALHFYHGDEGWVVSNSTFTPSAKELARRAGVRLIDGYDLARLSTANL